MDNNFGFDEEIGHLRDVQTQAQKKTFTKWVNKNLSVLKKIEVQDLFDDMKDGTVLLDLLQVLAGEKLPRSRLPGNQNNEIIWTNNIAEAFRCLERHKVPLVNIHTSNIVDGEPKIILGLVWQLILHFHIMQVLPQLDETCAGTGQGDEKKQLLAWVQTKLSRQDDPVVKDFGKSWRDGNAFLALVRNLVSERCSANPDTQSLVLTMQNTLRYDDSHKKLELAFDVADKKLDVASLLEVEDVAVEHPDEKSVMMYVAQFVTENVEQQQQQQQQAYHQPKKPEVRNEVPLQWLAIAVVVVFIAYLIMFAAPRRDDEEEE